MKLEESEIRAYQQLFRNLIIEMESGECPQFVLFLETDPTDRKAEFFAECSPEFMGDVKTNIEWLLKEDRE